MPFSAFWSMVLSYPSAWHHKDLKQAAQVCGLCMRSIAAYTVPACHRNFGPENLRPGGPKFPTNFGPPGPILPEIMVRVGNIGPLTGAYMYVPKFPAVSCFTGNNGLPWKVSMQVHANIIDTFIT